MIKRNIQSFSISNIEYFKKQLLFWANNTFEDIYFLDSNNSDLDHFKRFDLILSCGIINKTNSNLDYFSELKTFEKINDWLFGIITYDLKNEFEDLSSNNLDNIHFPVLSFINPQYVFTISNNLLSIHSLENDVSSIWNKILEQKIPLANRAKSLDLKQRTPKEKYLETVNKIQEEIRQGVVYEMNYCIEFYAENAQISPINVFLDLNEKANAPFSSFVKTNNTFIISASPERYIQKTNEQLISQPIKGTAKRHTLANLDTKIALELENNLKERAENIMIVDLVRNDFHRFCKLGTVNVDELCKIYSFDTVHQMISTISGKIDKETPLSECLKNSFPMGSMTGAPKISAMQLIEQFEDTKRGIYSGSIGYITPENDFDFNVVIRTIVYNAEKKYLSIQIGSAITIDSLAEKEYDECLLKADALVKVLSSF